MAGKIHISAEKAAIISAAFIVIIFVNITVREILTVIFGKERNMKMKKSTVLSSVLVCAAITAAVSGAVSQMHHGHSLTKGSVHSLSADYSAKKSVTLSDAKKKALKDAGVSSDDAVFTKAETDHDNGTKVYEIEFHTDTKKYEYEIRVSDGKILEKKSESYKKPARTKSISLSSAKKKALKDAGVSSDDAVFTKAEADYDDGVKIFDIEFHTDTKKYEYEIKASNGKILEKDSENYQNPSSKRMTRNEALKIAYKDAGVSEKDVILYKCKLEHDDGIYVYEIEFISSSTEYEYEINAETGKIISEESESIDG